MKKNTIGYLCFLTCVTLFYSRNVGAHHDVSTSRPRDQILGAKTIKPPLYLVKITRNLTQPCCNPYNLNNQNNDGPCFDPTVTLLQTCATPVRSDEKIRPQCPICIAEDKDTTYSSGSWHNVLQKECVTTQTQEILIWTKTLRQNFQTNTFSQYTHNSSREFGGKKPNPLRRFSIVFFLRSPTIALILERLYGV